MTVAPGPSQPEMPVTQHRRWIRWLLFASFWTFIGLSFASQFYISSLQFGHPIPWSRAVAWSLGDWYVWAALSIPIIYLGRSFQFERHNWPRRATVHLAFSILFSLVYVAVRSAVGQWQTWFTGNQASFTEAFSPLLVKTWHLNLLIYWVIISICHAFDFYRKYQDRELRASALERRLAEARLQALQMQLNPHFLFNTLHAISNLMHKDVDAADRMVARLGDLLRYTLESRDDQEVTLKQELAFIERYLEIIQIRFGDRLRVTLAVEPAMLAARVPNLILQPLVENAVRHGIEPRASAGRIEISAKNDNNQLLLQVRDDGHGLAAQAQERVGLSNTRERLQQLYPHRHQLEFRSAPGGGLEVNLRIPLNFGTNETPHPHHR